MNAYASQQCLRILLTCFIKKMSGVIPSAGIFHASHETGAGHRISCERRETKSEKLKSELDLQAELEEMPTIHVQIALHFKVHFRYRNTEEKEMGPSIPADSREDRMTA